MYSYSTFYRVSKDLGVDEEYNLAILDSHKKKFLMFTDEDIEKALIRAQENSYAIEDGVMKKPTTYSKQTVCFLLGALFATSIFSVILILVSLL